MLLSRNRVGILGDQALHFLVVIETLVNPYSDNLEPIVCLKTTDETGPVPSSELETVLSEKSR